jgi:hypothetical protein
MKLCTKCLRLTKKEATIKPKGSIVEEVKEVQTPTKTEKTGTLSEAIQKSASKKIEKDRAETSPPKALISKKPTKVSQ